ncbi:hypothetical protein [Clostridium sp.]|uniref:hypothetical protein n=1 Tax=Clostridium sp. TaxID=1506 RepID=UPI002609C956|nr:hypothetical protein [Clostridium sp.]
MYLAFGKRVLDSEELKKIIEEKSEFKVVKDMSKGTKREDTVAYNLSIKIEVLRGIMEEDYNLDEIEEEDLFDEYLSLSEELATDLEEFFDEESLIDIKAYKWDESDDDIKLVIAATHESTGEGKLKDVMRRLLTQVE